MRVLALCVLLCVALCAPVSEPHHNTKSCVPIRIPDESRLRLWAADWFGDEGTHRQLENHGIPGAYLSVVVNGEVLLSETYGNATASTPMSKDALIPAADFSELFSTLAILSYFDALGKLDAWRWKVRRYVHGLDEDLSLGHLLTHSSGIDRVDTLQYSKTSAPDVSQPLSEYLSGTLHPSRFPHVRAPGSVVSDNAMDVTLAALMVETYAKQHTGHVAPKGRRFSTLVQEMVFDRCGLDSTSYNPPDTLENVIEGHYRLNDSTYPQSFFPHHRMWPARGAWTTPRDLTTLAAHLTAGDDTSPLSRYVRDKSMWNAARDRWSLYPDDVVPWGSALPGMLMGSTQRAINGVMASVVASHAVGAGGYLICFQESADYAQKFKLCLLIGANIYSPKFVDSSVSAFFDEFVRQREGCDCNAAAVTPSLGDIGKKQLNTMVRDTRFSRTTASAVALPLVSVPIKTRGSEVLFPHQVVYYPLKPVDRVSKATASGFGALPWLSSDAMSTCAMDQGIGYTHIYRSIETLSTNEYVAVVTASDVECMINFSEACKSRFTPQSKHSAWLEGKVRYVTRGRVTLESAGQFDRYDIFFPICISLILLSSVIAPLCLLIAHKKTVRQARTAEKRCASLFSSNFLMNSEWPEVEAEPAFGGAFRYPTSPMTPPRSVFTQSGAAADIWADRLSPAPTLSNDPVSGSVTPEEEDCLRPRSRGLPKWLSIALPASLVGSGLLFLIGYVLTLHFMVWTYDKDYPSELAVFFDVPAVQYLVLCLPYIALASLVFGALCFVWFLAFDTGAVSGGWLVSGAVGLVSNSLLACFAHRLQLFGFKL